MRAWIPARRHGTSLLELAYKPIWSSSLKEGMGSVAFVVSHENASRASRTCIASNKSPYLRIRGNAAFSFFGQGLLSRALTIAGMADSSMTKKKILM